MRKSRLNVAKAAMLLRNWRAGSVFISVSRRADSGIDRRSRPRHAAAMRRRLLACLPALLPASARAFRLEPPTAEVAEAYRNACAGAELHEALRAEVERALDGRPLPPEMAPRLAALTRCPFCGCAVAGATDHGENQPEPG